MDTGKTYHDSDGNDCSLWQLVRREPEWAESRIKTGEEAIEKVNELKAILKEASDYLDINSLTNIGSGSILHKKFKENI